MIEYKGDFDFKNSEVAKNFTAHIKEQLPWVDLARRYCRFLVQSIAPKNALIYDIGSANGENYRAFEDIIKQRKINYIELEPSQQMIDLNMNDTQKICIEAERYKFEKFDIAICFLTFCFIAPKYRKKLIKTLKKKVKEGGAIILLEKFNNNGNYRQVISTRFNMSEKILQGAEIEDVLKKDLALNGIQIPLAHRLLPKEAKCFFKISDFEGWIYYKK